MADTRNIRINVDIDGDNRALPPIVKGLGDTAKAADKAGGSFKHLSVDAKKLDADIAASTKRVAELRAELVAVGNDKGIRKALRGEESWLRQLTQIQSSATSKAINVPTPDVGRMTGPLVAGAVTGLAPFLAPLGAMVAGAVAGTIGTGGIAGGIAMASRDPRVQRAAQDFKESIAKEFFSGGDVFVGPIQAGLRQLESAFKGMDVPETFAKMAPHVTTIARGLSDLGENIMPGLNKAFDRMGPFAEAAADGFGQLGSALGTFMDDVTSSEGTVEGLETLFSMLSGAIVLTGQTLNLLSDAFSVFQATAGQVAGAMEGLAIFSGNDTMIRFWDAARRGIEGTRDSTSSFAQRAVEATEAQIILSDANRAAGEEWHKIQERIKGATKAQDEYFARAMAVPEANDALEASFDEFTESLKENGRTFDANTEKGRANRESLRDMITSAQDLRTAQINSGQSMTDVNRKYDETIAKIEAMADAAGVSKEELRAMAGDYYVNIYRREVTHRVSYFTNHDAVDFRKGYAEGGTTPAREPFWVGERGPELMFSDRSHFVATNAQSRGMASGSGSGGVHTINLMINGQMLKQIQINDALGRGVPESTVRAAFP